MPIQQMPRFKSTPDRMLEIPQPGIGGLNLKDLEFEQDMNQSPYMLNVMYRNGAFGKRFGQEIHSEYDDTVYSVTTYADDIFVHAGTKIYKYSENETTEVASGMPEKKGQFIVYTQELYYLCENGLFVYDDDNETFDSITPYVPQLFINCKPDGTHSDAVDEFNVIGDKFSLVYNGVADVTEYKVGEYDSQNVIDWDGAIEVKVDEETKTPTTDYTVDRINKKIDFVTAPGEGDMNVEFVFTMKADTFTEERARIYGSKFHDTFGGANNSRLFLAGSGDSKYYWSHAYDITYFPESNFATLGNTEEDITGFGRQYNVLIIFKPREVYSLYSYTQTSSTTILEEEIGQEGFRSQLVNARIGCDAPNSIQLINNLLTWFNSREGICTLVSTNIVDERNIRVISRNIERTNNFGVKGILDYDEDPLTVQSVDYNNKYFLVFPEAGHCFMWDYEISPYRFSSSGETPPRQLDWFLFDHFYVKQFLKFRKGLLYVSSHPVINNSLIKLTSSFSDVNFDQIEDGEGNLLDAVSIHSYYMTPFLQFGAVESLKNVKNIYVQCRGDTASVIDMWYYTEENVNPEEEPEAIRIGGKLWSHFQWYNFQWLVVNWANTFRRKCNLKKIQMASFYFDNDEVNRDMSITHIGLQYQIVKYVR